MKLNDISSVRSLHLSNFGVATLCQDWKLEKASQNPNFKKDVVYMAPELFKDEVVDLFAADSK